ncbi:MAG: hypothetical protein ACFFBH_08375 [Promethearchaeota archaeon]
MYVLDGLEILQGSLTLAFALISFILGILILQKYFKLRDKNLLYIGITWIFLISPWWPDAISFLLLIFSGGIINLPDPIYFFIANALIAPIFYTWAKAFTNLVISKNKKLKVVIVVGLTAWAVIFEIFFLIFYFMDYNLIGIRQAVFYVEWIDFIDINLLLASVFFTITGLIFSGKALRSDSPEIKLKGVFLLIAFITFTIGAVFDVLFVGQYNEVTLIIARTFVIIAAFSFYIGFILPKFIKKMILKSVN